MTGARYFAQFAQSYGVSHVFFVPAILLRGLAAMEELPIRRIDTHGEKAAAYMADGYARASGRPGLCMAQHVGGSNLAAGLRDAYLAGSPVIAITGSPQPDARFRHGYQEIEHFPQFDAVTKFNASVDSIERLPDLLRQAFREATSAAPGPVHIQLTGAHGEVASAEADLELITEEAFKQVPASRPEPDPQRVREALVRIEKAKRPVIVAGGGVMWSGAQRELLQFAEQLNIPLAQSLNAKSAVADRHPLNVGVIGTYSRACANRIVSEADLVIFIGSHAGAQVTTNWKVPAPGVAAIQIDIEAAELGRNYPGALGIQADAKAALARFIAEAKKTPQARTDWVARAQQLVAEWRAESLPMLSSEAIPMRPERLCKELSDALPEGGVVVSDTGHSGLWTGQMIELNRPGQRYIRCAGSLGWSFPASIGVKCALPGQPVVCFCGDGGFLYHIAELETAARCGINVIVLVNNNSAYNQEIPLIDGAYGGRQGPRGGDLWKFRDVDFASIAQAMGCAGMTARTPAEVKDALHEAIGMNRPVVINALSDVHAFAQRPWTPGGGSTH